MVQPANRAVLSRNNGQPVSLLGVWSAAGQQCRGNTKPQPVPLAEFSRLAANRCWRRKRLHRAGPAESWRGVRRVCGAPGFKRRTAPADAANAGTCGRVPAHLDAAACIFVRRSARAVLWLTGFVSDRRRRKLVAGDQSRPDARRTGSAAKLGRRDGGGCVKGQTTRRDLHHWPIVCAGWRNLDGHRRRSNPTDARRRENLGERHAAGIDAVEQGDAHRGVALRCRNGICRGGPASS